MIFAMSINFQLLLSAKVNLRSSNNHLVNVHYVAVGDTCLIDPLLVTFGLQNCHLYIINVICVQR